MRSSAPASSGTGPSFRGARIRSQSRRNEAHSRLELLTWICVDRQPYALADLDNGHELLGNGQLHAKRINPDDGGHFGSARDEISDADQAFGHDAGEWRANQRVVDGLPRERDPRAGTLQRAERLFGEVAGHLILLAHSLDLGTPLIVFTLRDDPLIEQ